MMVINNQEIIKWIQEVSELTQPKKIIYIDGSEEQLEELRAEAVSIGEMIKLNEEKLPGCYLYRSAEDDVAREESKTFICSRNKSDAGYTNNWMDPSGMYEKLNKLFHGCMKDRTMYVIPYSMAIPGSRFAKYGIELTDSLYVVLNMAIMAYIGNCTTEHLNSVGLDFTKGLHSIETLCKEKRYIAHFPEDNTIYSINSGYGGNALLGRKCFALRIASYLGMKEDWLAEHMLIVGIERQDKEIFYIAAAFPSSCGKTNLLC